MFMYFSINAVLFVDEESVCTSEARRKLPYQNTINIYIYISVNKTRGHLYLQKLINVCLSMSKKYIKRELM